MAFDLRGLDLRTVTRFKIVRYSTASAAGVIVGQLTLILCYQALPWPGATEHWPGIPANLASVTLGAVPNYTINRYWTWSQTGRNRLWGEIIPFWTMSVLGAILSTIAVGYADRVWGTTIAVAAANLTGFGVLWIAKFFVLDRLMWRVVHEIQPDIDIDEAGAGLVGALDMDEATFDRERAAERRRAAVGTVEHPRAGGDGH